MVNSEQFLHWLEIRIQDANARYDAACRRRWFGRPERDMAFGRLTELHAIRAHYIANSAPEVAPNVSVPEPELPPPLKPARRRVSFG